MLYYVVQVNLNADMDGVLGIIKKRYPFINLVTRFDNAHLLIFKYTNRITEVVDSFINNMRSVHSTAIDDADALSNGYTPYGF